MKKNLLEMPLRNVFQNFPLSTCSVDIPALVWAFMLVCMGIVTAKSCILYIYRQKEGILKHCKNDLYEKLYISRADTTGDSFLLHVFKSVYSAYILSRIIKSTLQAAKTGDWQRNRKEGVYGNSDNFTVFTPRNDKKNYVKQSLMYRNFEKMPFPTTRTKIFNIEFHTNATF